MGTVDHDGFGEFGFSEGGFYFGDVFGGVVRTG